MSLINIAYDLYIPHLAQELLWRQDCTLLYRLYILYKNCYYSFKQNTMQKHDFQT